MEGLLNLVFVDETAPRLVNPIELLNESIPELHVILDLQAYHSAIVALIDFVFILADEGVEEYFIVKRVDCRLFLLLLQHEEAGKDALFDSPVDKRAHFFLR